MGCNYRLKTNMNNKNQIKYHSAVVFVKDIEISKSFYTEILDQVVELDFGNNVILESGITLWQIKPDHLINQKLGLDSTLKSKNNRFEFYFETVAIDSLYEKLNQNNIELLHAVHEEPWGQRTVRFFDPDRHLIEVGEPLETFVKRLSYDMTPEEVSEKTSIPIDVVRELIDKTANN